MSKKDQNIFEINPSKASSKIALSSTMIGVLFFILTLILTLGPYKFNSFVVFQIVLAIPFLFVSILAYSKIAYWDNNKWWDMLGWFSVNIGNGFLLNVIGLMVSSIDVLLALIYFGILIFLMTTYSIINIYYSGAFSSKLFKFFFFLAILVFGGILPLFLK
ncbi:MAG: hypothetical protein WCV68_03480 [Candidatus Paceibacterota bacterium]|jgi:hypothetical protein